MTRAKRATCRKKRKYSVLKCSRYFKHRSRNCFRISIQKIEKAIQNTYSERRMRRRILREKWIQKINFTLKEYNLKYSDFIKILNNNIFIYKKSFYELLINNRLIYENIVLQIKRKFL